MLAGIYTSAQQPLEALRCYAEVERFGQETYALGEADAAPQGTEEMQGDTAKTYGLTLRRDARLGRDRT